MEEKLESAANETSLIAKLKSNRNVTSYQVCKGNGATLETVNGRISISEGNIVFIIKSK